MAPNTIDESRPMGPHYPFKPSKPAATPAKPIVNEIPHLDVPKSRLSSNVKKTSDEGTKASKRKFVKSKVN